MARRVRGGVHYDIPKEHVEQDHNDDEEKNSWNTMPAVFPASDSRRKSPLDGN